MKSILLVEDHNLNLKLFADLIRLKGYNLFLSTGKDAFEIAIKNKPDLILMDIQLDGISGIDITIELKTNLETKHIPVVAMTALISKRWQDKIEQLDFDAYLVKPIESECFFNTIDRFLHV